MKEFIRQVREGILDRNPTFVQLLGICPTLATTTSALNALGMGLTTTAVLVCSNLFISLLRKFIPKEVRIASFVVIISAFVSALEMLLKAFLPSLNASLGVFIPLIVVNCILLARAEAFASKNPPLPSIADGLGCGLGFTLSLTLIGTVREILGSGTVFGFDLIPFGQPMMIFILPSGAFLTFGLLCGFFNWLRSRPKKNGRKV